VPHRLPRPRHGQPDHIPSRRPQPCLPLPPLRAGLHRRRTHQLARPGRPARNPTPRSQHGARSTRPLKIFMPNGPPCQPPSRLPAFPCGTALVVAASADDSQRTAGPAGQAVDSLTGKPLLTQRPFQPTVDIIHIPGVAGRSSREPSEYKSRSAHGLICTWHDGRLGPNPDEHLLAVGGGPLLQVNFGIDSGKPFVMAGKTASCARRPFTGRQAPRNPTDAFTVASQPWRR
jgi:hypothetical protein